MAKSLERKRISDFSGGMTDFYSPTDMAENQFQRFEEVENSKLGKLEKVKLSSSVTADTGQASSNELLPGKGLIAYRTGYNGENIQTSTYWYVVYSKSSAGSRILRYDSSDGLTGDWEEILDGGWESGGEDAVLPNIVEYKQELRISDGNFNNAKNKSKWFGHIKRGVFGEHFESYPEELSTTVAVTFAVNVVELEVTNSHGFKKGDYIQIDNTPESTTNEVLKILRVTGNVFLVSRAQFGTSILGWAVDDPIKIYSGPRLKRPTQSVAYNSWLLKNAELPAPIVYGNRLPFDWVSLTVSGAPTQQLTDKPGEVVLHIHYPSGTSNKDEELLDDTTDVTFRRGDKYSYTFSYDYAQESSLAEDIGGEIGIKSSEVPTGSGKRCPGIQVTLNTDGGINERITAINLYWKPQNDVDWYFITSIDINRGWIDSPLASNLVTHTTPRNNMGAWIPCPSVWNGNINPDGYSGIAGNVLHGSDTGSSNYLISAGTPWNHSSMDFTENMIIFIMSHVDHNNVGYVNRTNTSFGIAEILSGNNLTLFNMMNSWRDESSAGTVDCKVFGVLEDPKRIATWYIPNDGIKIATYNSLTGRSAGQKIAPIRWNTSVSLADRLFYGNVDTEDENEQTVREKSRVYYSKIDMPEDVTPSSFIDLGKNEGDEIISITSFGGKLYIIKDRNIYIYNVSSGTELGWRIETRLAGVGAHNQYCSVKTPLGIVIADKTQIALISQQGINGLSLPIKETYQSLTFSNPILGYSPKKNELLFVNNTSITNTIPVSSDLVEGYKYNFNTTSWSKVTIEKHLNAISNFILGSNLEPIYAKYILDDENPEFPE